MRSFQKRFNSCPNDLLRFSESVSGYFDATLGLLDSHQGNLEILIAQQTGELLSPLYEEDAIRSDQVVEGEGFEFALGIDSVKVDVIESGLRSAIFVDEGESGAGDVVGTSGSEAFRDSFYESRFAGAEVAAQENDERGRKFGGKFAPKGDGLLCGVGDGFGCHFGRHYSGWYLSAWYLSVSYHDIDVAIR